MSLGERQALPLILVSSPIIVPLTIVDFLERLETKDK